MDEKDLSNHPPLTGVDNVLVNPEIPIKICRMNNTVNLPEKKHYHDSGFDVYTDEEVLVKPGQVVRISTGLKFEIPVGYELTIDPRSSFDTTPAQVIHGTVDSTFRGYVKISVRNNANKQIIIPKGIRLAQMIVRPVPPINLIEVHEMELSKTDRGNRGLGSTNNDATKIVVVDSKINWWHVLGVVTIVNLLVYAFLNTTIQHVCQVVSAVILGGRLFVLLSTFVRMLTDKLHYHLWLIHNRR